MRVALSLVLLLQDGVKLPHYPRRLFDCQGVVIALGPDAVFSIDPAAKRLIAERVPSSAAQEKFVAAGGGIVLFTTADTLSGWDAQLKAQKWEIKLGHRSGEALVVGKTAVLAYEDKLEFVDLDGGKLRGTASIPNERTRVIRADASRVFALPKSGDAQAFDQAGKKLWGVKIEGDRLWCMPPVYAAPSKDGGTIVRVLDPSSGKDLLSLSCPVSEAFVGATAERIYTSRAETSGATLRAIDLKTGKEIWAAKVPIGPRRALEGGGIVCAITARGFSVHSAADGAKKWEMKGRLPLHPRLSDTEDLPLVAGKLMVAEFTDMEHVKTVTLCDPQSGAEGRKIEFDEEIVDSLLRGTVWVLAIGPQVRFIDLK